MVSLFLVGDKLPPAGTPKFIVVLKPTGTAVTYAVID